jgi:hypothetical protein
MLSLRHPLQRWVWKDEARRGRRLLRFAEVEADGGRDLVRASELTPDPRLRRLYLHHALDESRHADIFHRRGIELLKSSRAGNGDLPYMAWMTPGERGLDDVEVERQKDDSLLAFLHLSEKAATREFVIYRDAVGDDAATRDVFDRVLRDEEFHMNYTRRELARISPERQRLLIWRGRLGRIWKGYLRLAVGLASIIGSLMLTLQYFVLLPPFAWAAKRAARKEPVGFVAVAADRNAGLRGQY